MSKLVIRNADFEANALKKLGNDMYISNYTSQKFGCYKGNFSPSLVWTGNLAGRFMLIDVSDFVGGEAIVNTTSICTVFDGVEKSGETGTFSRVAFFSGAPTVQANQSEPAYIANTFVQTDVGNTATMNIPQGAKYMYVYIGFYGSEQSTTLAEAMLPKSITLKKAES